jgi:hypothetical protein
MRETRRGRHIDTTSPRGYYFDYSRCADPRGPVGEDGLPLSGGGGRARNPAEVARYALGNLEVYLEGGSEARRDRFERAASWLADHMELVPGSFGGWAMPDPPPAFEGRLSSGWFSGATQAECVSTLVRASSLLGLRGAIDAAGEAFPAFRTPVEEGGLLREVGERGHEGTVESLAFIEEYPMHGRPSMTLAGHVRAAWSIFDYWCATGDTEAERLFERCVGGAEFVLDRYEVGRWARADLDSAWRGPRLSSAAGIEGQAVALEILADLTGRSAFERAAARWRGYAASPTARVRALVARTAFALANPGAPPG